MRKQWNNVIPLPRVYDMVEAFPKPTIAQINGFCVGGGVALSVCCDIRICGEGQPLRSRAPDLAWLWFSWD